MTPKKKTRGCPKGVTNSGPSEKAPILNKLSERTVGKISILLLFQVGITNVVGHDLLEQGKKQSSFPT